MIGYKKVFFLGIGGIGISSLARFMHSRGVTILGSDITEGEVVRGLKDLGVEIIIDQGLNIIPSDVDLVVYTNALKTYEPELLEKIKEKFKVKSYPELLGEVTKDLKVIAVSGTHGKTTTTAMIGSMLVDLGLGPTVVVGSLLTREQTNFIDGKGEFCVIEADEFERAFLNYYPYILVINNIDLDHLDYYKDLSDIQSAFRELAERVPDSGVIITDIDHPNVAPVLKDLNVRTIDYKIITSDGLSLKLPGAHNVSNAKVALSVARFLNLDRDAAIKSLNNFSGTWRRFEYKGKTKDGATVYDDYAHNPQKIKAAIDGAREKFPNKRITVVFQPHLFSRTKKLFEDFAKCFDKADNVIVAPIFAAREHDDGSVSHESLAEAIRNQIGEAYAVKDFDEIKELILKECDEKDVVLFVGAGDINNVAQAVVR